MPRFASPSPRTFKRFRLPSPVEMPWRENNVVPFLYFPPDPKREPAPLVIILHGYGLSKDLFSPIGPHLRRAGYAGVILDLPFHGERAVASTESIFPFGGDLGLYVTVARQMIADVAMCLAWARKRREVDPRQPVVVGFSLGGILCSLVMGLGLGFVAGVSLMAAGDWADMLFAAPLAADSRVALEAAGVTLSEAREAFREVTAGSYAEKVKSLLVVGGRRDRLVPPEITEAYCRRLDPGANRVVWKDSGHVPPIRSTAREVLSFLREKLRATANEEASLPQDDPLPDYYRLGAARLPLPVV